MLTTRQFLHGLELGQEHEVPIERGKTLLVRLQAIGEADDRGMRPVMATINGQMRQVWVRDQSVKSTVVAREKAEPSIRGQVAAPFSGVVSRAAIGHAQAVEGGDLLVVIE